MVIYEIFILSIQKKMFLRITPRIDAFGTRKDQVIGQKFPVSQITDYRSVFAKRVQIDRDNPKLYF